MIPLTSQMQEKFSVLNFRLEPENLSCDGEISMTAQKRRYAVIMREWKSLEKQVGRKVTQDEVWQIELAKIRK